jgi:hypothetical protein
VRQILFGGRGEGQFEKYEMGGACGTYRGDETYIASFGKEKLKERNYLVDIVIDVTRN